MLLFGSDLIKDVLNESHVSLFFFYSFLTGFLVLLNLSM